MSTTSEELKKLYKKLGGDEENIRKASTPAEILNGINELDLTIPGGIEDLNDVDISDPKAGDAIRYNGEKWVNDQDSVAKSASGNPIEISDGANAPLVQCVSAITGSQDLHGYDKPWVGGAGKNKYGNGDKTFVQAMQNIVLDTPLPAGTYTFSAIVTSTDTDNSDCLIQFVSGSAIAASGRIWRSTSNNRVSLSFTWSEGTVDKLNLYAAASYVNGAGDTATYKDIQIESGSTATSYSPYSNICPITAYTEGEIEVRGKNLVKQIVQGYVNKSTGLIKIDNDTETVLFYANEGDTYTVSAGDPLDRSIVGYVGVDTVVNGTPVSNITDLIQVRTWTATWTGWTVWYIRASISTVVEQSAQVEEGSTPTPYEPYTSTTHTTTYPSAIYRGSEDVVNGSATAQKIKWSAKWSDGGSATVLVNYTRKRFSLTNLGVSNDPNAISNIAPMATSFSTDDLHFYISSDGQYVYIFLPNDTDGNTDIEIAYTLATPTTSSVASTNLPIKSLNGYSHIESTTGDMEIEYITGKYQPLVDLISESSGGDSQHHYSTDEQVVGTWVDGSTVYEKTFEFSSQLVLNKDDWTDSSATVTDISNILDVVGYDGTAAFRLIGARSSNDTIQIFSPIVFGISKITIRYTKTSTRSLSKTTEKTSLEPISEPLTDKTDSLSKDEKEPIEEDESKEIEEEPGDQRKYLME